jgi:hypothetical protein
VRDAITRTIITLPEELCRSLTWDQGAEMAQHAHLKIDAGVQVYFCDPQSPWQRGTNENTNGLLRQYFPKGTDLSTHSAAEIAAVAAALNARPRKHWAGKLLPRRLTNGCGRATESVVRRPLESALPRPGSTDQCDGLGIGHLQRDAVDGAQISSTAGSAADPEIDGDVFDVQDRACRRLRLHAGRSSPLVRINRHTSTPPFEHSSRAPPKQA